MENKITNLHIENFKSIKKMDLECSRINIFIGEPNVGKSNILEALALLAPYYSSNREKFISEYIRYEEIANLFYDDDVLNPIKIKTNMFSTYVRYQANNVNCAEFFLGWQRWLEDEFNKPLKTVHQTFSEFELQKNSKNYDDPAMKKLGWEHNYFNVNPNGFVNNDTAYSSNISSPVKKYHYDKTKNTKNLFPEFLLPPFGDNLFTIISHSQVLRKTVTDFFKSYNLEFVIDKKEKIFRIQKNIDGVVTQFPYSLIADTFQRMIFYLAALKSNNDSILVLEEPEVHSYPVYVSMLANEIVQSKSNQFFIATHSPYLLNDIIENTPMDDVSVFLCGYKDYQTYAKKMTNEQLSELLNYGVDIFYNLNSYLDDK